MSNLSELRRQGMRIAEFERLAAKAQAWKRKRAALCEEENDGVSVSFEESDDEAVAIVNDLAFWGRAAVMERLGGER